MCQSTLWWCVSLLYGGVSVCKSTDCMVVCYSVILQTVWWCVTATVQTVWWCVSLSQYRLYGGVSVCNSTDCMVVCQSVIVQTVRWCVSLLCGGVSVYCMVVCQSVRVQTVWWCVILLYYRLYGGMSLPQYRLYGGVSVLHSTGRMEVCWYVRVHTACRSVSHRYVLNKGKHQVVLRMD